MGFLSMLLSNFLLTSTLHGGVDGGNPKAMAFYNMVLDLRISRPLDMRIRPIDSEGTTRIDGPLDYLSKGHFIVAKKKPQMLAGEIICEEKTIKNSKSRLFWVGTDCHHQYFKSRFLLLSEAIVAIYIP